MIQAELIEDSISQGNRLSTFRLTYPLFIHPQVLRHRVFSSSVSSARAIQPSRYRQLVIDNPVMPLQFGGAKKGMVAAPPLSGWSLAAAKSIWQEALQLALKQHKALEELGAHQEITNRILAPFAHVVHLVTATDWDNWYDLRLADDAQPEIWGLAHCMREQHELSTPAERKLHAPFLTEEERQLPGAPFVSAARCAQVSYLSEKPKSWDQSVEFALKLANDKHWSPFEHVAKPALFKTTRSRNFTGWRQLRVALETEVLF